MLLKSGEKDDVCFIIVVESLAKLLPEVMWEVVPHAYYACLLGPFRMFKGSSHRSLTDDSK